MRGYCDSYYVINLDQKKKKRSLTSYIFTFGGSMASWKNCLQHIMAFSTIKVEYIALIEAMKEVLWLKGIS